MAFEENPGTLEVSVNMIRAGRLAYNQIDGSLNPDGLSLPGWLILDYLNRRQQLTLSQELVEMLGVAKSTATEAIDKLCVAELVGRSIDHFDRRRKLVGITVLGKEVLESTTPYIEAAAATILEPMHAEDLDQLQNGVSTFLRNLGSSLWVPSSSIEIS